MARTKTFNDKFAIVDTINDFVNNPENVSRFLKEQLVELGFMTKVKAPELKAPGRGRMPMVYNLTGKAKSYRSLSGQWKRPTA